MPEALSDLTKLLRDYEEGTPGAEERLAEAVYADLRRMAERRLAERYGEDLAAITIQPTILASDTLMKMLRQRRQPADRQHFFALAARQMWRLLIDYQRARSARRPHDGAVLVALDSESPLEAKCGLGPHEPSTLQDVVARLKARDARVAEVFERRAMFPLTIEETAAAMGISHATVERDYRFARTWLAKELSLGEQR